jgi:hypothetical protein
MKVYEILIEAPKDPKGVVFEIFVRMLPDEITKASLKQVDDALRWLAKTAKSNPTVAEDIASSLVAGSKQMGISVREMSQMAEPHLLRVGIHPDDIQRAKSIAERLAEPSLWQKFKNAMGVGAKKEPKVEPTPTSPTAPAPAPTSPTAPAPAPTAPAPTAPAPAPTSPTAPAPAPAPTTTTAPASVPSRIAAAQAGSFIRKLDPRLWNWWQTADAIAMAYGVIEPWYTFKQRADKAVEEFATQQKNPDGSLIWKDKETLSKGVQIAAQEAVAQIGALLAGRKLIGFFTGVNKLRALPNKTREEVDAIYASLGAKGQIAFAAWLDSPPGRRAFDGWLWGQMYDQQGPEDERPPLAATTNSMQGQVAWALRQVSSYAGGFVKSFYDDARRSAGQVDSQGNDKAAATQQQQAAKDSLPNGGGVLNTTTEK